MKEIVGLIKKDLYTLKSYRKTLILFLLIFCFISVFQKNNNFLIVMIGFGMSMCALATFNYDEFNHSERYILTLPINKKHLVLSRYILVISFTLIGFLIGSMISILISMFHNQSINILELYFLFAGTFFGLSLIQAIQIPCIYYYGAEKGRIQVFIVFAIIALLIFGISYICINVLHLSISINELETWITNYGNMILIILSCLVYFISYYVSYHLVLKKDF